MFNGNNIIKKNETGFVNHNNPLKKILNISLDLFEAEQTGILKGTDHTGIAFLPTEKWDRGVMDRLHGKGIRGLCLEYFGKYIVSLKKLSPVYFYKYDNEKKKVDNDGIIAYVLRTCAEYYRKGVSVIVVPEISKDLLEKDDDYLYIPFYIYNGIQIKKSREKIKIDLNIVKHFRAKNCIFIFLPSYGILVINTGNETILQFSESTFTYEKEIKNRFNVLIDLVETASLKYLSELKGKRGSELLWRKEKQLRNTSTELMESEKLYRDLYENAPNAFLTIDKKGILIKCNKTTENLIKYTKKEMLNKSISDLFYNKEKQEGTLKYLYNFFKTNNSIKDYEIEIRHKQHNNLWVSISIEAIKDKNENLLEYRVIAADISKRKDAEIEKLKLEEQLRQSQKMEAVGTLAGGIAHDFNNILQAINGFTEIMLLEREENDPDYLNLSAIDKSVERAGHLIRKLLFFSRKAETEKKTLKINSEILNAKSILERALPKMIEIDLVLDQELWLVTVDAVQIEQVFLNLGSNASDSMPDGGRIVFKSSNITFGEQLILNQLLVLPGDYVQIDLSDSGYGIDADTMKHIFEPFFTTKDIGKGTGLGLASVYGIIKKHDGYIFCNSEIGKGTTFTIYLPAIKNSEEYSTDSVTKKEKKISPGMETILIVDDEFSILNFIFQALQRTGYRLFTVLSGEQALELYSIKQKTIDLIILDMNMPGMGGKKCLVELMKINPNAKVIISSGHSIDGQKKILKDLGAISYIAKPYKLVELSKTIREALDN
jgi:PAS domain S-box-containing protein